MQGRVQKNGLSLLKEIKKQRWLDGSINQELSFQIGQ